MKFEEQQSRGGSGTCSTVTDAAEVVTKKFVRLDLKVVDGFVKGFWSCH